MNKVIYEFYTNSARTKIKNGYRLVIDKETERLFRGEVYAFNCEGSIGRFSVNKSNIGVVDIIGPKDVYIYRYRTFASNLDEARAMAANAFFEMLVKNAMRFAEEESIFDDLFGDIKCPELDAIEVLLGNKM